MICKDMVNSLRFIKWKYGVNPAEVVKIVEMEFDQSLFASEHLQ